MLTYFSSGYKPCSFRSQPRWRTNWEFFAVIDGRCAPVFEGNDCPPLQENTLWILSPKCRYGWVGDSRVPFFRIVFHFGSVPPLLDTFVENQGGYYAKQLSRKDVSLLKKIATEVGPHFRQPSALNSLRFNGRLLDLTLLAMSGTDARPAPTLSNAAALRVESAIEWYLAHLSQSPSVKEVANAIHISPSHLRLLFGQVQQSSPRDVFRKVRLQKAQELMNQSTDTLEVIADRCGFVDASHLCREYKKQYDLTPTLWRKHRVLSFTKKRDYRKTEDVFVSTKAS